MTWQECELIEKDVQFIVPDVSCSNKQELWYHEPEPTKGTELQQSFSKVLKKFSLQFIIGWEPLSTVHYTRPDSSINRLLH